MASLEINDNMGVRVSTNLQHACGLFVFSLDVPLFRGYRHRLARDLVLRKACLEHGKPAKGPQGQEQGCGQRSYCRN